MSYMKHFPKSAQNDSGEFSLASAGTITITTKYIDYLFDKLVKFSIYDLSLFRGSIPMVTCGWLYK